MRRFQQHVGLSQSSTNHNQCSIRKLIKLTKIIKYDLFHNLLELWFVSLVLLGNDIVRPEGSDLGVLDVFSSLEMHYILFIFFVFPRLRRSNVTEQHWAFVSELWGLTGFKSCPCRWSGWGELSTESWAPWWANLDFLPHFLPLLALLGRILKWILKYWEFTSKWNYVFQSTMLSWGT